MMGDSYASEVGYKPYAVTRVANVLIVSDGKKQYSRDKALPEKIGNMNTKIGFMLLARNYIQEINGSSHKSYIWVDYHLTNFVYDTKAFLDSVAVTLNYILKLGYKGGQIDLRHDRFIRAIKARASKHRIITKESEEWIKEVIRWRDAFIHRISSHIGVYVSAPQRKSDFKAKMLLEPLSQSELGAQFKRLMKKYGRIEQEILPFCDRWIANAMKLYETTCDAIADHLSSDYQR
jgi:hypothetical protein